MSSTPWGSITGIRPVKIVRGYLQSGLSPKDAQNKFMSEFSVSEKKARLAMDIALREISMLHDIEDNDACLYIGVPFCKSRCLYCSFVTAQSAEDHSLIRPFVDALIKEIRAAGEIVRKHNLNIVSVYFGGGTPTILSPNDLTNIINVCKISFDLKYLREFSVEAGRPDTIDLRMLETLKKCGVTRISINPQSMKPDTLGCIGRSHTPAEIISAFYEARKCGFNDINMDVIAGLPFEVVEDFKDTLRQVAALNPESVTVHTMCVKKGSRLYEALGELSLTNALAVEEMIDYAAEFLTKAEKRPYYLYRQKNMLGNLENTGYAKAGFECLYNVLMMEEISTVISLGGGGVTKTVNRQTGHIARAFNVKEPKEYIARIDEMIKRKTELFSVFY